MKTKHNFSKYNDGVISLYREKKRQTNFNAKQNVSVMDDLTFICKLDFGQSTIREQDLKFAEQSGFSLTMKVRTRLMKEVDKKCKAIIEGYLYDVKNADKDRSEMWLYLEGIKEISEGE